MKLPTTLTLLGYVALAVPACHADAPSSQSPSSSAGSAGSTNNSAGSAGSTSNASAGSSGTAGGSAAAGSANNSGGTSSAGSSSAGAANNSGGAGNAGSGGVSGATGASGGAGGLPPLQECTGKASIDRLTDWTATSGECTCTPVGNILTKEGQAEVAKVVFMGTDWHVVPVLITNQFGKTADVSSAPGITLSYSATAALHVQARSGSHWDGGDQWAADVPSTSGMKQTLTIPFDASKWKSLFGAPVLTLADTLKELQGLVFVGDTANTVVFYGLRIQGFEPACP